MTENVVVEVAKEVKEEKSDDGVYTLSTGVRVKVSPVSPSLISEVTSRIKYPDVPLWFDEKRGKEMLNPADPQYIRDVADVDSMRGQAAMDAMVMFGIELLDGLPEDETWITKLNILGYEISDDPVLQEFYYKKHIAIRDLDDWAILGSASGVRSEDIEAARESFQGDESGTAN